MQKNESERELKDLASLGSVSTKTFFKEMGGPCCYGGDTGGEFDKDFDYYKPVSESLGMNSTNCDIFKAIDTELGLSENYFSRPEGYFCFSTSEELEMAICRCKDMIMSAGDDHDRKKCLVSKLVDLKLKLQEIEDAPEEPPDLKVVLGHNFDLRSLERPHQYCEKCCGIIWGMMRNWYRCVDCGFKCHSKCLNLITRICAKTKVLENCSFELSICPEIGLSQQKFRCAECKRKFIFKSDLCSPRQCSYNGLYYCSHCHWNSSFVIPARVVHDWDLTPRKVCRASLQFLRLMLRKPILYLEALNSTLFALVPELEQAKKLREDILVMKGYFLTCHSALEEKLLLHLKERQHFVESAHMYSLQDLMDAFSGDLTLYLEGIHASFVSHITQQCQGCRGKGFICELCKSEDIIFPFEPRTDRCHECSSVFHRDCYLRKTGECPKCARRNKTVSRASHETE